MYFPWFFSIALSIPFPDYLLGWEPGIDLERLPPAVRRHTDVLLERWMREFDELKDIIFVCAFGTGSM